MRGWRRLGWSREIRRRDGSRGYTAASEVRSRDKEPDDGESRNK